MRLLLDSYVWGGAKESLEQAGHDVVWAGGWPIDPGDEELQVFAERKGRMLVTLDKDFGEIAVVRRIPHRGILRLVNMSAVRQATACSNALERYGPELQGGAIVTVEPGRTRVRTASPGSIGSFARWLRPVRPVGAFEALAFLVC